jgi:hypothetical protein
MRLANYKEEDLLAAKYAEVLDKAGYDLFRVQFHDHLTDLHIPSCRIFQKRNPLQTREEERKRLEAADKKLDYANDGNFAYMK